jgi:succinate dehydrogenase / fumarate reductase flavoprotein subunit
VVDGKARGIIARNLVTGEIERHGAHAVLLCTGGYGNVFFLSTNAMGSNVTAAWKAHKRGAYFGNPCYTQIHPTCIPVSGTHQSKLTLMSESLRNDGRIWVPKKLEDAKAIQRRQEERPRHRRRKIATTTWSAAIRPSATWCRATWPAAPPKSVAMPASA